MAAGAGTFLLGRQAEGAAAYAALPAPAAVVSDPTEAVEARDDPWVKLKAANPDVVAWLRIEGAEISLPVCQAGDKNPDYYLTHDLWGNESVAGCVYADCRCNADSPHVLAYGHHLTGTGGMLSALYDCHEQDAFDAKLSGGLVWLTPDGGHERMDAFCSLAVDESFADIQRFDFGSEEELRAWLGDLCSQASARSGDAQELVAMATRVVTLVTCSSLAAGQIGRTVVVFVA